MFPGMVFAILSRDPDFVQDVAVLQRDAGAEVFAAASWEEYARLQEEKMIVEAAVVDPVSDWRDAAGAQVVLVVTGVLQGHL